MARQSNLTRWLQAWLLPAISLMMLAAVVLLVARRWQQLHGTVVPAVIYQKLGKVGSGSSSRYRLVAKYQQPQGKFSYTQLTTNHAIYDEVSVGQPVSVGYAHNAPQSALLASEWSFSGYLIVLAVVGLATLLNGLSDNKAWRNRRRDGYLPD
jgi:hypothetical protein